MGMKHRENEININININIASILTYNVHVSPEEKRREEKVELILTFMSDKILHYVFDNPPFRLLLWVILILLSVLKHAHVYNIVQHLAAYVSSESQLLLFLSAFFMSMSTYEL